MAFYVTLGTNFGKYNPNFDSIPANVDNANW